MVALQVSHKISHARTLSGHVYGVGFIAWSPNDEYLLACGAEDSPELYLWNAKVTALFWQPLCKCDLYECSCERQPVLIVSYKTRQTSSHVCEQIFK